MLWIDKNGWWHFQFHAVMTCYIITNIKSSVCKIRSTRVTLRKNNYINRFSKTIYWRCEEQRSDNIPNPCTQFQYPLALTWRQVRQDLVLLVFRQVSSVVGEHHGLDRRTIDFPVVLHLLTYRVISVPFFVGDETRWTTQQRSRNEEKVVQRSTSHLLVSNQQYRKVISEVLWWYYIAYCYHCPSHDHYILPPQTL